jgi:hypothetical protein
MIMKVEDFDDERLDGLHLMRVGQHLAYYMQQFNPYKEFLYGPLEQDELDQLNAMFERGASKDEILLTLHEWADVALDEYAKPMEQCAIEHLAIELDWEREVSGEPKAPTGVFLTLILDNRESVTKGWAELEIQKPRAGASDQRDARLLVDHDGSQWHGPLHQIRDIGRA